MCGVLMHARKLNWTKTCACCNSFMTANRLLSTEFWTYPAAKGIGSLQESDDRLKEWIGLLVIAEVLQTISTKSRLLSFEKHDVATKQTDLAFENGLHPEIHTNFNWALWSSDSPKRTLLSWFPSLAGFQLFELFNGQVRTFMNTSDVLIHSSQASLQGTRRVARTQAAPINKLRVYEGQVTYSNYL